MSLEFHTPTIYKFGRNVDSDTGDDVWDGSEPYPFPSAAATTTIVSASTADASAGTGAKTVQVEGLDSDWMHATEVATMDGDQAVTLSTQFLRVYRAKVLTAGTGETNAGNIQIKHGSTVLAQISAAYGQTLMAIYTLPATYYGWLANWRCSTDGNTAAKMALQTREFGGAWQTKDVVLLDTSGSSSIQIRRIGFSRFPPKTDFRVRVLTGGNVLDVVSQFDLLLNNDDDFPYR